MTLQEIFNKYRIELTENGKPRKLSDVLEDMYMLLNKEDFLNLTNAISRAENLTNVFEDFRKEFEE
jgi:hypothetical protein